MASSTKRGGRTIRFRIICHRENADAHDRVMELLAARSVIPDFHFKRMVDDDRVALEIVVRDLRLWAKNLAQLFARLPSVLEVELEINSERVNIHSK